MNSAKVILGVCLSICLSSCVYRNYLVTTKSAYAGVDRYFILTKDGLVECPPFVPPKVPKKPPIPKIPPKAQGNRLLEEDILLGSLEAHRKVIDDSQTIIQDAFNKWSESCKK